MTVETVEGRAVRVAARVLVAAGICRHEDFAKCRRVYVTDAVCERCVRAWLLAKARQEIKRERKGK